jgi:hypothetical protein
MTETLATTATQAEIDADTYAAFTRNGENKAAPAAEAGDHGDHDHGGDAPAAEAGDEKPAKDYATECVDCGFKFSRPQARKTCQSAKACQKRQDARAAAAAAE